MPKADREHTTAGDTGCTRPDTITDPKRPSGVFARHPVRPNPGTGFHTCPKAGGTNTTADDAGGCTLSLLPVHTAAAC